MRMRVIKEKLGSESGRRDSIRGGTFRFRAKREKLKRKNGLLPESQSQKLALIVLNVPCSLDSGYQHGGRVGGHLTPLPRIQSS